MDKVFVRWLHDHYNQYRGLYSSLKVLSLGLVAVAIAYKTASDQAGYPSQALIKGWLSHHQGWVLFFIGWPFLTQLVEKWYAWRLDAVRASDDLSHEDWKFFTLTLNDIVGAKCKRFASCQVTEETTPGQVFTTITQPEEQIARIIVGLYVFISGITNDRSLKVVLAVVDNNIPVDWLVYMPMNNVPSRALFDRGDKTLFAYCAVKGDFEVIQDIAREVRYGSVRYASSESSKDDKGSILCYPIANAYVNNRVIYALSMKSDRVNVFNDAFVARCGCVIESFITRLVLETNLVTLKKEMECHGKSN